ncbi:MAG: enolase C-terminal domain-like protein, partial [Planctomycetota bacterium]
MITRPTDVRPVAASLYFLPVELRMPLKFGTVTMTHVTCARVKMTVSDASGNTAEGWGETPLSVGWVWPSQVPFDTREECLKAFCLRLTEAWANVDTTGHPMTVGHDFTETDLADLFDAFNAEGHAPEPMPWLAALVCSSAFDIALHDAYGQLHDVATYDTYNEAFMNEDLSAYLTPAEGADVSFEDMWPNDYFPATIPDSLPAWHLVGGKDPLDKTELDGSEPDDGYPVTLVDWIDRDGLNCLKVKLRGNDPEWDWDRLVRVGQIALDKNVDWLTSDFNCTVTEPDYVNTILDRMMHEHPTVYGKLLYVEQPFPYDLEHNRIDVHGVSARKPLFMDESAHDWHLVKLGRSLGWTGVALKTCKTQTGALLSACWAKAHGMTLMVQDLTNPMLAQVPHVLLAAHVGTIMGVETNAMQFYPEASTPEAGVHPGLYRRRGGKVDLSTLEGPGFGYRTNEIDRPLGDP